MSKFVRFGAALRALALSLSSAGCSGHIGPPALVLQAFHITRARATERAYERQRELAFSASLALALDRGAVAPREVPTETLRPAELAAHGCGPAAALCRWAEAEEHAAWLATLEQLELQP